MLTKLQVNALLGILIFCFTSICMGQERTVTGKVTDASNGSALPGVNVVISGTTTGTSTNTNGEYTLSKIPPEADSLSFSFIGYQRKTIAINGRLKINVQLSPSIQAFDEVVVTSFGVKQEKQALGYSVQEVGGEEVAQTEQPNLVNALRGEVAGVNINSSGGESGTVFTDYYQGCEFTGSRC